MKTYKMFLQVMTSVVIIALILFACNSKSQMPNNKGSRLSLMSISLIDSIPLSTDSISWVGNFFSFNGRLCFADQYYCTLFMFDWDNGKLVDKMLGHGHSKTEIEGLRYIYTI